MVRARLLSQKAIVASTLMLLATCLPTHGDESVPYHAELWTWLQQNNYKHWSDVAPGNGDFRPSSSPHGDFVKLYVNRSTASQAEDPVDGSVLVLENYNENHRLISINVMQRAAGFDPLRGNWYYATFLPGGQVAKARGKTGEVAFAGKVSSCIECHRKAWDDDFVFFND